MRHFSSQPPSSPLFLPFFLPSFSHILPSSLQDAVSAPRPREHEISGRFGPEPTQITASYTAGGQIEVELDITANHVGSFQFRLCDTAVSDCNSFSGYSVPLELADGTGTRMIIPRSDQGVAQRYSTSFPPLSFLFRSFPFRSFPSRAHPSSNLNLTTIRQQKIATRSTPSFEGASTAFCNGGG